MIDKSFTPLTPQKLIWLKIRFWFWELAIGITVLGLAIYGGYKLIGEIGGR